MTCAFEDLRNKEIIHVKTGSKIGYVDDVVFETRTAKVVELIVYGRSRFFGLFGREDDFVIPWSDIDVIGGDTILVSCDFPHLQELHGHSSANSTKSRSRLLSSLSR